MSDKLTQQEKIEAQICLIRNLVDTELYHQHVVEKRALGELIVQRIKSLALDLSNPAIHKLVKDYQLPVCWVNIIVLSGSSRGGNLRGYILPDAHHPQDYHRVSHRNDRVDVKVRQWELTVESTIPILDVWSGKSSDEDEESIEWSDGARDAKVGGTMRINQPSAVFDYHLVKGLRALYQNGMRVVSDKEAMSVALCSAMENIHTLEELEQLFPAGAAVVRTRREERASIMKVALNKDDDDDDDEIKAVPSPLALARLRHMC